MTLPSEPCKEQRSTMAFLGLTAKETTDPAVAVWSIPVKGPPGNHLVFHVQAARPLSGMEAVEELLAAAYKAGQDHHAEALAALLPSRLQRPL